MTIDANEIVDEADEQTQRWKDNIRDAANFFHHSEGKLYERNNAVHILEDELDVSVRVASQTLSMLTTDVVDPVVLIEKDRQKYVGIVEYEEFDGAYGYVDFHDFKGKRKSVVCAKCVQERSADKDVVNATAGEGSFADDTNTTYEELLNAVHQHYENAHDSRPEDIETGASLATGTTIGGSEAWHKGNDGDGSGLDADAVDGFEASALGGVTLDSSTSVKSYAGEPSTGQDYVTVFDKSTAVDVLIGELWGDVSTGVRVTFSDATTTEYGTTSVAGRDSANHFHNVTPIPSIKSVKKLEVDPGSFGEDAGYKVVTIE